MIHQAIVPESPQWGLFFYAYLPNLGNKKEPDSASNVQFKLTKKIRYRIVLLRRKPLFFRHLDDHSFLLLSLTSLLQSMASRSFCLLCFYSTSILCFRQYKTEQLFYFLNFYDSSYLHKKTDCIMRPVSMTMIFKNKVRNLLSQVPYFNLKS